MHTYLEHGIAATPGQDDFVASLVSVIEVPVYIIELVSNVVTPEVLKFTLDLPLYEEVCRLQLCLI